MSDNDICPQCLTDRRSLDDNLLHCPLTLFENLWARTQQTPVEEDIRQRRWRWLGHTLRKPPSSISRQALNWNPQGQRKRGRPRNTWRRELEKDIKRTGHTWKQLEGIAQDTGDWRVIVGSLCSGRSKGPKPLTLFFLEYNSKRSARKTKENAIISKNTILYGTFNNMKQNYSLNCIRFSSRSPS